ncbi:hypothetical protein [Priestia aryabhattai]|uniref:hypothetical protein n=1 Tax=Priestia aryabhattai TaxID=412384 RepID=UPI001873DE73|nr:hypothetical protein [Priestia aryabhattai]MBE5102237.1 hypothetical protein [Priestia aryabhattai]
MKQKRVLYNGKEYIVLFKYSSGYWEVRDATKERYFKAELVHHSQLKEYTKEGIPTLSVT